ncbi:MAG: hypothetical protein L3J06_00870 [Cyclobacteriaceae bacterium]|nr:hypothetical protein [Cyclobacteriaceae bacterium]
MLSYFKLNDPFRLLPVLVLVFLIKIPAFLNPVYHPEITHWFTIGEAMQGGNSMYIDIWDGMAPFSAVIYMVVTWLFGKSILSILILGTVLTYFQAIIINNFSIKAKLFENNTYLPALIYILLTSTHPAFFTLSPSLMGLTMILLGLGKLLSHVEFRAKKDLHIIMIGLFFGSAPLFYLPLILIIPISLVLLMLFSNTVLKRYLLLLFTSLIPLSISFYYYWIISDQPVYFINNFLLINYFDEYYSSIGWSQGLINIGVGLFFIVLALLSFGKQRRLNNYQIRVVQLFFVLGLLLMLIMLLEKPITSYSLVIFMPIATFFTVHLISLFKKKFFSLILSLTLFTLPTLLLWSISQHLLPEGNPAPSNTILDKYSNVVKGKKIMVLGSAKDLYINAKLAGPFYDWGLSQSFFEALDYYDNLVYLQKHFEKSNPGIIIDLENNWPKILKRLPAVAAKYRQAQINVWVRMD